MYVLGNRATGTHLTTEWGNLKRCAPIIILVFRLAKLLLIGCCFSYVSFIRFHQIHTYRTYSSSIIVATSSPEWCTLLLCVGVELHGSCLFIMSSLASVRFVSIEKDEPSYLPRGKRTAQVTKIRWKSTRERRAEPKQSFNTAIKVCDKNVRHTLPIDLLLYIIGGGM